ncbi:lateral signaling target protein 2 homolog isoform X1 [Pelobates fuscus]|uniref:lateral signaling target protein 2 homolog isoform X1 n=2 Tax=Pelobates fuscus TaxID=191477 RepID=UPI002FE431DD
MLPSVVRRWLNRPKKSDPRLLARFFYVDEDVNAVMHDLRCLDIEKEPASYLIVLTQLHNTQDRMLLLFEQMLEQVVPKKRRPRDYYWKFPDDNMPGYMTTHLLFAAELMVGGTYVEVEETDGETIRPLAQELLRSVVNLRSILREQSLEDPSIYPEQAQRALLRYDYLCAEFELRYMSLVSNVKTPEEIYEQQEVAVLFCETVSRALQKGYITQEMIDDYEPELMISIPRLAIISGLLIYPDGPLSLQKHPEEMCELFSPFYTLLKKIKELLLTLTEDELFSLERALCSSSSKDTSIQLSNHSESPDALDIPSQSKKQPEPKLCSVDLSPQPESKEESLQECSGALASETNKCSSTDRIPQASSVLVAPLDDTQISTDTCNPSDQDKSSSENRTCVLKPTTIVQCVMKRTSERHRLHARKSRYHDVRSRYRSDGDMLHRLFVCISGVADQLQTNFANDLRNILKSVFDAVRSKQEDQEKTAEDAFRLPSCALCQNPEHPNRGVDPASPEWVPDSACNQCTTCCAPFTLLRRRHHCRSCGKIFCSRCSAYTTSLPHLPNSQPVRVCSHCFHVHCRFQSRHVEGAWFQD